MLQAQDIAIVGRGTLDGQGQAWWDFYRKISRGGTNTLPRTKWQEEFSRLNATPSPRRSIDSSTLVFCDRHSSSRTNAATCWSRRHDRNSPFWNVTPVFCDDVNSVALHHQPSTSPTPMASILILP